MHDGKIIHSLATNPLIKKLKEDVKANSKPIIFYNEEVGGRVTNIFTYRIPEPLFTKLKGRLGDFFLELDIKDFVPKNKFEEEALSAAFLDRDEASKILFISPINEEFELNESDFVNKDVL